MTADVTSRLPVSVGHLIDTCDVLRIAKSNSAAKHSPSGVHSAWDNSTRCLVG